jgi:transposase-like protein
MSDELNLITLMQQYPDADSAREYLEKKRWPNGPVCPHCESTEAYKLQGKPDSKRPVRKGVYKCKGCRKQFTVTVGTIFEDSHIPLNKWLLAIHLLCSSKKGMSAHQLHRMLKVTYKSAWFMAHRIRYAMTQPPLVDKLQGVVEVDETYVGGKRKNMHAKKREALQGRGSVGKTPVVTMVERNGRVRSFAGQRVTGENLKELVRKNVEPQSVVFTDEHAAYTGLAVDFAGHGVVAHGQGEYVRGQAHINTAEGYFSLLKRGIVGVYHHVSAKHLHRYCGEFDFRYNAREVSDGLRTEIAIMGVEGKRLMYRVPVSKEAQADT